MKLTKDIQILIVNVQYVVVNITAGQVADARLVPTVNVNIVSLATNQFAINFVNYYQ